MIKFNIILKYIVRHAALFSAVFLLSGCLGGSIAQQIVRSIATSVADKAMARALDVDEYQETSNRTYNNHNPDYSHAKTAVESPTHSASLPKPYTPAANQAKSSQAQTSQQLAKQNLENTQTAQRQIQEAEADPYRFALANTAFEQVKPEDLKPIAEPLPTDVVEAESPVEVIQSSQLVRVELYNLLIGEEKNAVYEQARLMGSSSLPQKREWALWRVGTGAIQGGTITSSTIIQSKSIESSRKTITFLIPPEFGKLPSGAVTMVELASPGELNVARYKAN